MAAAKKAARKSPAKKKAARKSASKKKSDSKLDLSKYIDDIKIGNLKLDDVLEGGSKNMDAIAAANRAIIDGYTDVAKRQYEMLKDLLDELKGMGGDNSDVVKELKQLVAHAKKDVQTLQKMANKTNSRAQQIIKKRTDANLKAWKKLIADARKAVSKKAPKKASKKAPKKAASKKKAVAKKKAARKTAPKKKAAAKAAPKAATPKA